jgi:AraC-like DNA-binding protein/CheY-like chemotaxis protein
MEIKGVTPPLILCLDLTAGSGPPIIARRLERHCRVIHCQPPAAPHPFIEELSPDVICFDFDFPVPADLELLQDTKLRYPSIPILMFTADHSPELVVWALRTRVWDCFLKPVSTGEIMRRLNIMLPVLSGSSDQRPRKLLMPERGPFTPVPGAKQPPESAKTQAVLPYLEENYREKITLSDAARVCAMDPFEFSRSFKREHGVTFRDYMIHMRIAAAADMLRNSRSSVLDVACSVGFNDHSHFSRLFRRYMGVSPSVFRKSGKGGGACPEFTRPGEIRP